MRLVFCPVVLAVAVISFVPSIADVLRLPHHGTTGRNLLQVKKSTW
jgi:hypothetical protein